NAAVRRAIPHALRAHADAVLRVDQHECEIRHALCRKRLADEVEIARRVEDVELLAHPRAMQQRRLRGNLALPLADVIIRNGGALRDAAHTPYDACAREHRLAQRRLAGRRVTDDGKVPNVRGRRRGHNSNPRVNSWGFFEPPLKSYPAILYDPAGFCDHFRLSENTAQPVFTYGNARQIK